LLLSNLTTHQMVRFRICGTSVSPLSLDSLITCTTQLHVPPVCTIFYSYNKHKLSWNIWIKHGNRRGHVSLWLPTGFIKC